MDVTHQYVRSFLAAMVRAAETKDIRAIRLIDVALDTNVEPGTSIEDLLRELHEADPCLPRGFMWSWPVSFWLKTVCGVQSYEQAVVHLATVESLSLLVHTPMIMLTMQHHRRMLAFEHLCLMAYRAQQSYVAWSRMQDPVALERVLDSNSWSQNIFAELQHHAVK